MGTPEIANIYSGVAIVGVWGAFFHANENFGLSVTPHHPPPGDTVHAGNKFCGAVELVLHILLSAGVGASSARTLTSGCVSGETPIENFFVAVFCFQCHLILLFFLCHRIALLKP